MKIKSPDETFTGKTRFGELELEFKDGEATLDDDLPHGVRQYMQGVGYTISGKTIEQADVEPLEPADPRKLEDGGNVQVGTKLRDAAVDPEKGDFLPPTNAGEANPHGPDVVSPEIHASEGVRPVKGGEVHVDDPDKQNAAELQHTAESTDGTPIVVPPVPDAPIVDVATEAGALPVKDQLAAADSPPPARKAPAKKAPAKKAAAKKTAAKKAASSSKSS